MKKLLIATLLSGFLGQSAVAETFKTSVVVNNVENNLSANDATPMVFPALTIDSSTENDQSCSLGHNWSSYPAYNQLCRNLESGKQRAQIEVAGAPLAQIQADFAASDLKNGLELSVYHANWATSKALQLNETGLGSFEMWGIIYLRNKENVVTETTIFDYNVTLSYL